MLQRWDFVKFKESDPQNFDKVGEQFIRLLQINIREINYLFNTQQFAKSLICITEIICQSKKIYAIQLGEAAANLKIFLEEYIEEIEGITYEKQNFKIEQQQEAAIKFINIMEIAEKTIQDWYQFKHLPSLKLTNLFEKEINQIKDTYNVLQNRNCSFCQLI
ncbi:unnamed protein product [Paramecium primaurelia]|uniref:Uncharacterized protein n=1 Tax=Paramecium primaurelia TaxID=5886 RepID=A0A8S1M3F0_PARPR|nr:unnamed protein product [Paramecium primaurelia]